MTNKALEGGLVEPACKAGAKPNPVPELERLRLRFELELFQSQNAGAGLDPLLRTPPDANGPARHKP